MLALGLLLSRYEVEIWARVTITNMFFHVGQKTNLINKNRVKIVYLFSFFKVYLLDTSSIASRGENLHKDTVFEACLVAFCVELLA